jgi:hypothetical protein
MSIPVGEPKEERAKVIYVREGRGTTVYDAHRNDEPRLLTALQHRGRLPAASLPCEAPEAVATDVAAEGVNVHNSQEPLQDPPPGRAIQPIFMTLGAPQLVQENVLLES